MTQYWLKDINLEKVSSLSEMLLDEDFNVIPSNTNNFAQQFNPGAWQKGKVSVRMYHEEHPVFINTDFGGTEVTKDPNYKLIKRMISQVEAKGFRDKSNTVFDMSLFYN